MTDRMKVGRERYAWKIENQAHIGEISQNLTPEKEKSGKRIIDLTGSSRKWAILRISLNNVTKMQIHVTRDPTF